MTFIASYEILEELGRGGMAVVYRTVQPSVNRPVALKVLQPFMESDPQMVLRFKQEAEVAASFDHPNIVRVWSASTAAPPYYIAMEYMSGGSLAERLRERQLSLAEALEIVLPICGALDHAHSKGVIHRDIKPENILFNENGRPSLIDFGIARATAQTRLTADGSRFGTAEYMSPEQAKGKQLDYRSDLYSLAVVLFEILTGQSPFNNPDPLAVMHQIIHNRPPLLTELNPQLPASLNAVMIKALDKVPDKRFQSGAELAKALQQAQISHQSKKKSSNIFAAIPEKINNLISKKRLTAPKIPKVKNVSSDNLTITTPTTPLNRSRRNLVVVTLAVVLLALAAAPIWILWSNNNTGGDGPIEPPPPPPPTTVKMPNLIGKSFPEAKEILNDYKNKDNVAFTYTFEKQPVKAGEPPFIILHTLPKAGVYIQSNRNDKGESVVIITMSAIFVPDVVGYELKVAEETLKNKGINNVYIKRDYSTLQSAGKVYNTVPKAGALPEDGTTVWLYISRGTKINHPPTPPWPKRCTVRGCPNPGPYKDQKSWNAHQKTHKTEGFSKTCTVPGCTSPGPYKDPKSWNAHQQTHKTGGFLKKCTVPGCPKPGPYKDQKSWNAHQKTHDPPPPGNVEDRN